jgi:L-lactate dehydrogenase complex protein LldF
MSNTAASKFIEASEQMAFDKTKQAIITNNIAKYDKKVKEGKQQFSNLELAKTRAATRKMKAIENIEKYLIEFESVFIKKGGKVIWAQNAEEAFSECLNIMQKANAKLVTKAKSMVTEEINFNSSMAALGIKVQETDLGEYIVQLRNEKPYHIVTPAMHLSKQDVTQTFAEKKHTDPNMSAEDVTRFVRQELRPLFAQAQVGVTGANFLIADIGAVAVTENEGNAGLSANFPKTQIVIAGIEKVIPSINDIELFWSLLATYGTGQQITSYNNIYSGPKQADETDGPEEMYVILLDNGRTEVLAEAEQRRALSCIKCGACLNACPIYQTIGGHAYGTTYNGPIGSVITPLQSGLEEYKHLSHASTGCGKCTEVCPMNIDIHNLLSLNRKLVVEKGLTGKTENWMWYIWKGAMLKRSKMEKGGVMVKSFMIKQFFRKQWGEKRAFPQLATKSFNQLWREKKGLK